jgi:hypothetical protein
MITQLIKDNLNRVLYQSLKDELGDSIDYDNYELEIIADRNLVVEMDISLATQAKENTEAQDYGEVITEVSHKLQYLNVRSIKIIDVESDNSLEIDKTVFYKDIAESIHSITGIDLDILQNELGYE